MLKNPRYAGAFAYGRSRGRKLPGGKERRQRLPREEWHTLICGAHPGYLSWEEYEENLARLHENAQANGAERRKSPPREGPALLQGLAVCGRCGARMTRALLRPPRAARARVRLPEARPSRRAQSPCQRLVGAEIDRAVGELLVKTVTPLALEVTLAVQEELRSRAGEADELRRQGVERARYEAELAQRRYLQVDPDNRLVAASLEADWNAKLRTLAEAEEEYDTSPARPTGGLLGERQQEQILALASDFPRLWADPQVPQRERKRMVRLLLEDVTLLRGEEIVANVRFRGGATHSLRLPLPLNAAELRKVDAAVVAEVDRLLDEHTDAEIVEILERPRPAARGRGALQPQDPLHAAARLRTRGPLHPPAPARAADP